MSLSSLPSSHDDFPLVVSLSLLSDLNPSCLVDQLPNVSLPWPYSVTPPPSLASLHFFASYIDPSPPYYPSGYSISPPIRVSTYPSSFVSESNPSVIPYRPCFTYLNTFVSGPPSSSYFEGTLTCLAQGDIEQRAEEQDLPPKPSLSDRHGKQAKQGKKSKCVKAKNQDVSLCFGEGIQMGELSIMQTESW